MWSNVIECMNSRMCMNVLIRAPALRASAALKPGRVPRSSGYVHPHWRAFGARQRFRHTFSSDSPSGAVRHSAHVHAPCSVIASSIAASSITAIAASLIAASCSSIAATSTSPPPPWLPAPSPPVKAASRASRAKLSQAEPEAVSQASRAKQSHTGQAEPQAESNRDARAEVPRAVARRAEPRAASRAAATSSLAEP